MPLIESSTSKETTYLVNKIVNDKRFDFDQDVYGFAYINVANKKIVTISNKKIKVLAFDLIANKSIQIFEKLYKFSWSDDLQAIIEFYRQIEHHFDGEGYLRGRYEFSQQILKRLLIKFKTNYDGDVFSFVKNFKKGDHEIYDFSNCLGEILPELNLTTDEIITMLTWLAEEIKVEQENVVDLNLPMIGQGLRKLCTQKPLQGRELFNKCILTEPQQLLFFHPSILSGLLDHNISFLSDINKKIITPSLQPTIVCALGAIKFKKSTPFNKIIRIVESIDPPTENYYFELPRFYVSIIKQEFSQDESLIDYCFNKILSLVKRNDKRLHSQILLQLRYLKNFDKKVAIVLSELINQDYFDESYVSGISNMFYNHSDCSVYFQILRLLALKLNPNLPLEKMANDYQGLRNKNKESFDIGLINLLIDDEGYLRLIGTRMLSRISMSHHISGFGYDVLLLPPVSQYKLVITLAESFQEPKEILPYLIPLISSSYNLVRELTLHKLEILAESFGQTTIDILKKNLDLSNIIQSESVARIEEYLEQFELVLDKKRGIKELDPSLTMYKYLKQFYISREKNMRERMNREPDKDSFLSLIPTVKLMKGGGWKASPKNEVSKLGTIQTSMRLPREYVLSPQQFDWNRQRAFNENWKNKFDQWEAIISL